MVKKYPLYWELYDMEADRSELQNLVDTHPDLVLELEAIYNEWAERVGVQPWNIVWERLHPK